MTIPTPEQDNEFVTHVIELMSPIGSVYANAMFGGYGIYLDGLMFALIADGVLYLKSDGETENDFKALGLEAFTYLKKGKAYKMSYFQAPEAALEDAEEMTSWANQAYTVALKAAAKKQKKHLLYSKNI